jgi:hypothetical protein
MVALADGWVTVGTTIIYGWLPQSFPTRRALAQSPGGSAIMAVPISRKPSRA